MANRNKKYHIILKDLSLFEEVDFKGKTSTKKTSKDIAFDKLSYLERDIKGRVLHLNGEQGKQKEPVVSYDYNFGHFRAGRFIGDIIIDHDTILSIRPKFENFFNNIIDLFRN